MPISLWLLIPLFFLWTLLLNYIANYLIHNQIKTSLFPIFEVVGTLTFTTFLCKTNHPTYFVLLSALLIVVHTDFNSMLISRFTSLYLVPTGIIASYFGYLPINTTESCISAIAGYGVLYIINKIFYVLKKFNGIGQGDFELMALIGSYTGLLGCWFSILLGSVVGTIIGSIYLLYSRQKTVIMPFGVFLSFGTICYVIFQDSILSKIVL